MASTTTLFLQASQEPTGGKGGGPAKLEIPKFEGASGGIKKNELNHGAPIPPPEGPQKIHTKTEKAWMCVLTVVSKLGAYDGRRGQFDHPVLVKMEWELHTRLEPEEDEVAETYGGFGAYLDWGLRYESRDVESAVQDCYMQRQDDDRPSWAYLSRIYIVGNDAPRGFSLTSRVEPAAISLPPGSGTGKALLVKKHNLDTAVRQAMGLAGYPSQKEDGVASSTQATLAFSPMRSVVDVVFEKH